MPSVENCMNALRILTLSGSKRTIKFYFEHAPSLTAKVFAKAAVDLRARPLVEILFASSQILL
jgi:hypothetical protein